MTVNRISTVLEVDAGKAVAGFAAGAGAAEKYAAAVRDAGARAEATASRGGLGRLTDSIRDNRAAWDDLSSKAMIGGAALAGGLGLATKAAIDWESSWAGVTKTVDGTPEQMAELEDGLRGLAKELPATHTELAAVAEAAGQLGVARDDILGFTETAVALGESTNLSADEAAESLAKMSNIMGTASREGVEGYERMGAALVALGNDGASTEADIMAMSLRLAGAGKQIGATEADILAMANALSSVGIEAELGGGAMSRAMLKMNTAVISGGDELEKFAEIAYGTTGRAADFAKAWREDPIAATNDFISGLGRIGESGGDASAALDSVGLSGTQNAQVMLRAAGASDLVTESLELGAKAWDENAALAEEAGKRYETTESKLQIAKNTMKDAAIDLGAVFGPMLAGGAEKLAGFADAFVKLPEPIQKTAGALSGVAASTLLLGGGAVKVIGWGQDISDAFAKVTSKGADADGQLTRTGRTVRGMARWGGYAAGVYAVATAIGTLVESTKDAPASVEQVTKALLDMDSAADTVSIDKVFGDLDVSTTGIDDLAGAFQRLTDPSFFEKTANLQQEVTSLFGLSTDADQLTAAFDQLGQSLAAMPADEAAAKFDLMVEAVGGGEANAKRLLELMPAYRDSLTGAANDAKLAGDGAAQAGDGMAGMGEDAQTAEEAVDDLSDAIRGLGDALLQQEASQDAYEAALDSVTASIKENGYTLDANTEAGRANRAALRDLANETQEWAAAELEAGGSVKEVQAILDRGREKWIAHRDALGANKKETRELADELFNIDGLEVTSDVKVNTTAAAKDTQAIQRKMKEIDGQMASVTITENATEARDNVLDLADSIFGLTGKTVDVDEQGASPARSRVMALDEEIVTLNGKTVTVKEEGASPSVSRLGSLKQAIAVIDGKTVTVTEVGSTAAGNRVVDFKGKIYEVPSNRTANVRANVSGLWDVAGLRDTINSIPSFKNVTVRATTVGSAIGVLGGMERGGIRAGGATRMADGGVTGMIGPGRMAPGLYKTSRQGILMAEDPTAPFETYISGAARYRARSEAILAETARRFGKQVIPMASGGIHAARTYAAPSPAPVVVQSPTQGAADVVARLHPSDIKAIVAGVQQGAYAGTSQREADQLSRLATTPRGRSRG